jgi:molybdopterin-containing oxidoreductase family iron-sulfur binding subunit
MNNQWRSLNELADTPEFRTLVEREFPGLENYYESSGEAEGRGFDRRRFLQLMAASLGLLGLTSCRRPQHEILPYNRRPEDVTPGLPTFYATTIPRPGCCFPVIVENHEGRPTKIEGHPTHPYSRGASDIWAQASILDLYDPDRSKTVLKDGKESSWEEFDDWASKHFAELRRKKGEGLAFYTEDTNSPAVRMLRGYAQQAFPSAVWYDDNHMGNDPGELPLPGNDAKYCSPHHRLEKADVVLSLNSDFLGTNAEAVRHTRDFMAKRRSANGNRLYVVEPHPTLTGAMADHRLALPASQIDAYAKALLKKLGESLPFPEWLRSELAKVDSNLPMPATWIDAVAADLILNRGKSAVVSSDGIGGTTTKLTFMLNEVLGNNGVAVQYLERPGNKSLMFGLIAQSMARGQLDTLVILGRNPIFEPSSPGVFLLHGSNNRFPDKFLFDISTPAFFADYLGKVPNIIHLGLHVDETAEKCHWHLPAAHYLESWGDAESSDGTYSPIQPLIAPLYGGRSPLELLARLLRYDLTDPHAIMQRSFAQRTGKAKDDSGFRRWLHDGFLANSARKPVKPVLDPKHYEGLFQVIEQAKPLSTDNLEVTFHPDNRLLDGRHANNGWLQELPDPITKLTWDNAAVISPKTAQVLNIKSGDMIQISVRKESVNIPAFILPGQADFSIALPFGNGRRKTGRVGSGNGFDVNRLRSNGAPYFLTANVQKTGRHFSFASTQDEGHMEGRDLVRFRDAHGEDQPTRKRHERIPLDLATQAKLTAPNQWGMVIDLTSCTGCSACLIACQAENNIPIVGKGEVQRGRIMHWIRLDRYFVGDESNPEIVHQPVMCMHCEAAPCEPVCPVNAAVHSPEGLNLQVYNRCIGTRYCSNNCPYKARRFNWFDYHQRPLDELRLGPLAPKGSPEPLPMQKNPDVTVRMRGIMEKCTYCIQRIERGKLGVKLAHAGEPGPFLVPDGSIVPACAQACPAQAITFGNIADPNSHVAKLKQREDNYDLLEELNTRPRTSYLARLRNRNPAME